MRNAGHFFTTLSLVAAAFATNANAEWTTIGNSNEQRFESAVVTHQGKMIAFNGFSPAIHIVNSVEEFNPNTNAWKVIGQTETGLGNAVTHTGAVVNGNDVWLIGGRIGNHPGAVSNKVWIFNLNTKKWRQGPKLPRPFAGGGAAKVGNTIHVFGGLDSKAQCDVNYHYTYNVQAANGWKDITAAAGMPLPRNHFSTLAVGNKIYALGGQTTHGGCGNQSIKQTNIAHVFNTANNKWTRLANLPFARSHAEPSTFAHGGVIYMVGGATNGTKVITYNPSNNKWTVRNDLTLPAPILAPAARIMNNRFIVAMGGVNGTRGASTVTREFITPGSGGNSNPPGNNDSGSDNTGSDNDGSNNDGSNSDGANDSSTTGSSNVDLSTITMNTGGVCTVTGPNLQAVQQQYASACQAPRRDCDYVDGSWMCSSAIITNGNTTTVEPVDAEPVVTPPVPTEPAPVVTSVVTPVANVETAAEPTSPTNTVAQNATPATVTSNTGACIDSDGDGWGWNGLESCRIGASVETPAVPAVSGGICIDTDGDGWGWNGSSSCVSTASTQASTASTEACVATAATLALAKQNYAATCSLPRVDCDPINGSWTCSSENIQNN